jgi:signal transduction histidine kinase
MMAASLILITIVIIIAFLIARSITRPIAKLTKSAEIIGKGDLEHRVELKTRDEIGELAASFNRMADNIKGLQEELTRKEKLAMLGQLAGGVGHELRNPLGVISNAIYYLKTILPDTDETTREYLNIIFSEVARSNKIISDLLDLSRTRPTEREEVEVSRLVAQVLEQQSPPENTKVVMEIPSELPLLFVDPRQIHQALVNLVTNAFQAMPEGGRVTIIADELRLDASVKNPKSKIRIRVSDTGTGISRENMEKLFEPLFTTKASGIGLGLAVSKSLVQANSGSIEVESPSAPLRTGEEGRGSTFTVILPSKEAVS